MILDSSTIVSIFFQEPGYEQVLEKFISADTIGIGSATLVEAVIVLSARLKKDARPIVSRFLIEGSVNVLAFDQIHFGAAVEAWLRYGKGHHSASLNFGDCLAYATARIAAEPLLCTGKDFSKTDLELA
jgi:ribonuclease VapC